MATHRGSIVGLAVVLLGMMGAGGDRADAQWTGGPGGRPGSAVPGFDPRLRRAGARVPVARPIRHDDDFRDHGRHVEVPSIAPGGCVVPPVVDCHPASGLVERIAAETQAFVVVFGPTADCVPEGRRILSDARRLRDAAGELAAALRSGGSPRELERLADRVVRHGGRLVDRVARVARGRIGPNIDQVDRIGALCGQLAAWRA